MYLVLVELNGDQSGGRKKVNRRRAFVSRVEIESWVYYSPGCMDMRYRKRRLLGRRAGVYGRKR
jgi:hypothetical protein